MLYLHKVEETYNELVTGVIVLAALFGIVGILATDNIMAWLVGTVAAIAVDAFILQNMISSLDKALEMDQARAKRSARTSSLLRYVIVCGLTVIAARFPQYINVFAMLLSIFYLKFSAFLQPVIHRIFEKNRPLFY